MKREIVFLDTETTGLTFYDNDLMELSIISLKGKGKKSYLFNKLLKPGRAFKCSKEAYRCHQISDEMVKNEKNMIHHYDELKDILKDKLVIIYNESFDRDFINDICFRNNKEALLDEKNCFCLMEHYAPINGDWNEYHESYKWVRLQSAYYDIKDNVQIPKCDLENIKAHRALGDCLMAKYIYIALKNQGQINI